ncbi:hypothetical protein ACHHYP_15454 [Achlya hypogyna]|uniref:Uncharacterized protein n=1 Tax=Achlya hypogyna TaxID=1202772 RepID=A0A1V9YAS6_ACHHY|nr:hypothetical protein ACHHYP_15454 [Achlya hypogyna]
MSREPLASEAALLRSLDAYESTYGDVDVHDKVDEELSSLTNVLEAAVDDTVLSPSTVHRLLRVLLKRRFGASSVELQVHMLFLAMHVFSKPIADDAEALALLYEFMMEKVLPLGLAAPASSPYGSLFFAFALLLRRVEHDEAIYRPMVSILKARRHTEASEFEMDDSMCDVALEKGRLLGGLSLFAAYLAPLAPSVIILDLAHPIWGLDAPAPVSPTPLLQAAAYPFVLGFTKEFELLELTKSEAEWLRIIALLAPVLTGSSVLTPATYSEVHDIAGALPSLFPWRMLPRVQLLSASVSPNTLDAVLADLATTDLYTNELLADVPHAALNPSDEAWIVTTESYRYANDDVVVPAGTTGQKLRLPNEPELVCWHLAAPVLPILLHRLRTQGGTTAVAVLALLASLLEHHDPPPDSALTAVLAPAAAAVGAWLHDATTPLPLLQACLAFVSALAARGRIGLVVASVAAEDLSPTLLAVVSGLEAAAGQYPSVLNVLELAAHALSADAAVAWQPTLQRLVLTVVTSYSQWRFATADDADVVGLASLSLVRALLRDPASHSAWAALFLEAGATFPCFVFDSVCRWFPAPAPLPKPAVRRFAFADSTAEATPFLPVTLPPLSTLHAQLAEALLECVQLVVAPLVAHATPAPLLQLTVRVHGIELNWPLVCTAFLASSHDALVDAAVALLTAMTVLPASTSLVAQFPTPQDTTALVDALWRLVQHAGRPAHQAAALRWLALSVDAQPSLVSLLFFGDGARSTAELLRVLAKAVATQDWPVVAHGLDLVRAAWPTLFAADAALWTDVGAGLLADASVAPDASAQWWAHGLMWQLVALEAQHPATAPLAPLLTAANDWLAVLTAHATDAAEGTCELPVAVQRGGAASASVFALVQFAAAMEVVLFKDGPATVSPAMALTWACTIASSLASQIEAVATADRSLFLRTMTRFCLALLHRHTQAPSPALDAAASVELLKCFLAVLQATSEADDDARTYLMTSVYLVLRHMAATTATTALPSVVATPLLAVLGRAPSNALYLAVLQELVVHWMSPLFAPALSPLLQALSATLVVGTKVDVVAGTAVTLAHLLRASPAETAAFIARDLVHTCQIVGRLKAVAQPLTSAMLRRRSRGYDDATKERCVLHRAWCALLDLSAQLLRFDTAALSFIAYAEPVLLSAFEPAPVTLACLDEQALVGRLLLAATAHLSAWRATMGIGGLLELARAHLVVASGWKQDSATTSRVAVAPQEEKDPTFEATVDRRLSEVVYLWCVLLLKLTPSVAPVVDMGGRPVVDTEAARPILDYLPISMAHATAPCSLGHVARLVKSALKDATSAHEVMASESHDVLMKLMTQEHLHDVIEAGSTLLVANYLLHDQRYVHPAAYRAELKLSIADIATALKTDWKDDAALVAFAEGVEAAVLK